MIEILVGFFQSVLVAACLVAPSIFFLALASLVRLLPAFLVFLRTCLRAVLIVSYRLYNLVLTHLAPVINRAGIDVLEGTWRVVATTCMSLVIGALVSLLALHLLPAVLVLAIIHGLVVGLVWGEIEQPGGLQLGARL